MGLRVRELEAIESSNVIEFNKFRGSKCESSEFGVRSPARVASAAVPREFGSLESGELDSWKVETRPSLKV